MQKRLDRKFFERDTLTVAKELLGKQMVFNGVCSTVTETEAYIGFGQDDEACHAARGMTPRTRVMFGPGGFSYVYFIYGMYHCLNFVTAKEGNPAAVLIRGVKLEQEPFTHLDGPGKLCRDLGITKKHNEIDLTQSRKFYVNDVSYNPEFITTTRIGISKAKEKPWRFLIKQFK